MKINVVFCVYFCYLKWTFRNFNHWRRLFSMQETFFLNPHYSSYFWVKAISKNSKFIQRWFQDSRSLNELGEHQDEIKVQLFIRRKNKNKSILLTFDIFSRSRTWSQTRESNHQHNPTKQKSMLLGWNVFLVVDLPSIELL